MGFLSLHVALAFMSKDWVNQLVTEAYLKEDAKGILAVFKTISQKAYFMKSILH